MSWRYFFKQLWFPPSSLILLLLACWALRKHMPRLTSLVFKLTLLFFYVFSLPLSVQWFARHIETEPAIASSQWSDLAQQADAIVILGSGREAENAAWESEQPSALAMQRIRYASRLAKVSELPILASGGLHFGQPPSEAQLTADVLASDFAVEAQWVEGLSRTTWENAQYTANQLHPLGIRTVVLVTDAWHMPRARWSFERAGFKVVPAPVSFWSTAHKQPFFGLLPESKAFWQNSILLNEWLGKKLYQYSYGKQQ